MEAENQLADMQILEKYIDYCTQWTLPRFSPSDHDINVITEPKIRQACGLVRSGRIFSLNIPQRIGKSGAQIHALRYCADFSTDFSTEHSYEYLRLEESALAATYGMSSESQVVIDTLLGIGEGETSSFDQGETISDPQWDNVTDNFWQRDDNSTVATAEVTEALEKSIPEKGYRGDYTIKIITRGVLIDLVNYHNGAALSRDHCITAAELDAFCVSRNIEVTAEDAVLIHTGYKLLSDSSYRSWKGNGPQFAESALEWMRDKDISVVALDSWYREEGAFDQFSAHAGIPACSAAIGEMLDVDVLAKDSLRDGVYEFMFVTSPVSPGAHYDGPVRIVAVK